MLQMAFLFTLALIFLPNVGLWSLYREKHLMKAHEGDEQVSQYTPMRLARACVKQRTLVHFEFGEMDHLETYLNLVSFS